MSEQPSIRFRLTKLTTLVALSLALGGAWVALHGRAAVVFAEPGAAEEPAASFDPVWIQQLRDPDAGVRDAARAGLLAAGAEAVPPLAEAIADFDHESAGRGIDILERLSRSEQAETREAARQALQDLSESTIPSLASLAQQALLAEEEPAAQLRGRRRRFPGRFAPEAFGGFEFRGAAPFGAMPGKAVHISTQVINGARTITVDEQDRKITIEDENGRQIRIKVVATVEGKEQTTEYTADDLEKLRATSPDAAELYETYAGSDDGGIGLGPFNAFPFPDGPGGPWGAGFGPLGARGFVIPEAGPLPDFPRGFGFPPDVAPPINEDVEQALTDLESVRESIETLQKNGELNDAAAKDLQEKLAVVKRKLFAVQAKIER